MSKIYDALHKASQGEPEERPESSPPPSPPEIVEPVEPFDRSELPETGFVGASPFHDELDQLRANLDRMLPQGQPQSIMVVGAVPGEGASTVATNFAQVLSEDPRYSVMYMDADLRNRDPRLVDPVEAGEGFAGLLEGRTRLADVLRPTDVPRLDVLPSEGLHQSPYRSTSGERIAQILAEAKQRYNRVLVDAAPVLAAPETAVMAREVDGVVLVVRSGREKREVIQEAVEELKKRHARILGVVINRQKYVVPGFIYRRL